MAELLSLVTTPDQAFSLVLRLCGISVAISTMELLSRRDLFESRGCLSWKLLREFYWFAVPTRLESLLAGPGVRVVLIVRLVAAGGLVVGASTAAAVPCALALTLSVLFLNFRLPIGRDGSDQMNDLIVLSTTAALLCRSETARTAALFFIAAQASLAYATAGLAKLVSPVWRSGEAIAQILSTMTYGHEQAAVALRSSRVVSIAVCWSVVLFETLFVSWLLLGPDGALAVVAVGLAFHAGCAVLMGLNCFFWSFAATYPAIILTSTRLGPLIDLGR